MSGSCKSRNLKLFLRRCLWTPSAVAAIFVSVLSIDREVRAMQIGWAHPPNYSPDTQESGRSSNGGYNQSMLAYWIIFIEFILTVVTGWRSRMWLISCPHLIILSLCRAFETPTILLLFIILIFGGDMTANFWFSNDNSWQLT